VGGALVENGYPMLGRYTSANAVANGEKKWRHNLLIVCALMYICHPGLAQEPGGQERMVWAYHPRQIRSASKLGRSLAFDIQ
jgi:hypothetical protein